MPRAAARTVPRINPDVVRKFYRQLPQTGASDYYVMEKGQHAINWCCLRVQRTQVQIGLRKTKWFPVGVVSRAAALQEIEDLRDRCRKLARELEDEETEPSLKTGRSTTWAEAWTAFRAEYERRKAGKRSPRTLEFYEDLFRCHVLPLYGGQTLTDFAALPSSEIGSIPETVANRVKGTRSHADGSHTGNHVLRAMSMVWEWCRRAGWIVKDPFLQAEELQTKSAEVFLEDADLAAIGAALRALEAEASAGTDVTRQVPSKAALLALRVVLYTGCRHREELLLGKLEWLRTDFGIPRIEVPRAKGERREARGRFVYLGPDALRCVENIPRAPGCDDLVPGRKPGSPMHRLTEAWERVILEARRILEKRKAQGRSMPPSVILKARIVGYKGEQRVELYPGSVRVPVKATRHTIKTIHPRAGIAPDYSRQLMGHEAAALGDRVYLHQHGPSLSEAAATAETYIRGLMGDLEEGVLRFRRGA